MKRDRTVIWHRVLTFRGLLPLMVAVLTLSMTSCTKELIDNQIAGGNGMEVRVTFPVNPTSKATTSGTEVGNPKENQLDRVTILIFNEDGTKLETVLSEDVSSSNSSLATTQPKWATEQTLIVTPVTNPRNAKKIYAIANWSKVNFDKNTYTETELKDELTTIANVADINDGAAMLMSGNIEVTSLMPSYRVTVEMERQSAKIRANLSITTAVQNTMPQIEWQINDMKITVVNVPNKSFVIGRTGLPGNITMLNLAPIAVDDVKPLPGDQTTIPSKDLKWSESVYITENPVTGATSAVKDLSTYIIVQLPYKNRITGIKELDNYYKIHINNTNDAASPHKVLRNTIYNFNIKILGIGLPINNLVPDVNVEDVLTVNGWEKGEIINTEATNNYFNVDRATLKFQNPAQTIQCNISTDVADWKLIKDDGTTVLSFGDNIKTKTIGNITYTLSGTANLAVVTVSKPVTNVSATQRMSFVAKNLNVPFTVVIGNAIIPSAEYIKVKGVRWATGNLVANGPNSTDGYKTALKIGAPSNFGLYFKFGSLVGWSGGASGDGIGQGNPSLKLVVLPETYNRNIPGTSWSSTCYYQDQDASFPPTDEEADKGVGDPCRYYLGDKWRLPTTADYEKLISPAYKVPTNPVASPVAGREYLGDDGTSKLFFPFAGSRADDVGGALTSMQIGYYYTMSIESAHPWIGYIAFISSGNCYYATTSGAVRQDAMSVRCVKTVD